MSDKCPCEYCFQRILYERQYNIHFWGSDCPYLCENYKKWANKEES